MDSSEQPKNVSSSWDGSISRSEFRIAASAFAERWNKFNPDFPWCSWVPSPRLPWPASSACQAAEGYLSLENVILPCTAQESYQCNDEEAKEDLGCSDQVGLTDEASLVENHSQARCHYDFHIVYSTSYRVPVLYFRACYSYGQPLALDELEKNIPANSAKLLMESKWSFITQEDHPYLNRPWYTLHPCGTREWMKMLFMTECSMAQDGSGIDKYLVSWFSVVGQIFGLKIPFEMLGALGKNPNGRLEEDAKTLNRDSKKSSIKGEVPFAVCKTSTLTFCTGSDKMWDEISNLENQTHVCKDLKSFHNIQSTKGPRRRQPLDSVV